MVGKVFEVKINVYAFSDYDEHTEWDLKESIETFFRLKAKSGAIINGVELEFKNADMEVKPL